MFQLWSADWVACTHANRRGLGNNTPTRTIGMAVFRSGALNT